MLSYMSPQQPGLNGMLLKNAFEILKEVENIAEYHSTKSAFYISLVLTFYVETMENMNGESHELQETPKDVYSMWVHVSAM